MKNLRTFAFFTAASLTCVGAAISACSDDPSVTPVPVPPVAEAGPDAPTPVDASQPDVIVDGGADVATDSPPPDSGINILTFSTLVADKLCNSLARCCYGSADAGADAGPDGGTFDRTTCQNLYRALGFESSSVGEFAFPGGNVDLDEAAAKTCFDKVEALSCSLTGASLKDIRTACFGATTGKLAAGAACQASAECAPGNFCNPSNAPDAGFSGTCAPLATTGGNCGMFQSGNIDRDTRLGEEACSYRGSGSTGLRCDSYDFVANDYRARVDWTCQPSVANGENCNTSVWCTDGLCDPDNNYVCTSPLDYFNAFTCKAFLK